MGRAHARARGLKQRFGDRWRAYKGRAHARARGLKQGRRVGTRKLRSRAHARARGLKLGNTLKSNRNYIVAPTHGRVD